LEITEHRTKEDLHADSDRVVETYTMAPANFSMNNNRVPVFSLTLEDQEWVAGEAVEAGLSCNNHRKETEAASCSRLKILKTHMM
jgi:hypothetical protein